jgi:eukaryotic-like serine/threonine-protein kinase
VLLAIAAAWLSFRATDSSTPSRYASRVAAADEGAPRGLRLSIPLPQGLEGVGPIAISRDGQQIAYCAVTENGERDVYLRRLDDFAFKPVEGSRDARTPFFSPDGTSLGFFARGAIWRASTAGGPPVRLHAATGLIGADWMDDDSIVYSEGVGSVIQRISAAGAALKPITTLTEADYAHVWPQQIAGTDHVLFTRWGGNDTGGASIADLETGTSRRLSSDAFLPPARWSASGHLLIENFAAGVFVARFDPDGDSLLAVQLGEGAIPREIRVITEFFDEIERASKAGD